ncbi:concanavalin A-like lectin/glucanase domain-containing protein [Paraphysoderma sedebokerense]|nr:concanavalin A-like lectin/glucanase domain-containing protein [Paraphysoderma sedebokerense]
MVLPLIILTFICLANSAIAGICPNAKKQCDKSSPCCNSGGYCTDEPMSCYIEEGCNPDGSFPNACIKDVPKCKSFREDFNRLDAVPLPSQYRGNPDWQHLIDEYGGTTIENGYLVLTSKFDETDKKAKIVRVRSTRWYQYGVITARLRTGLAPGLVNSFIYKAHANRDDIGDEIDYEWVYKPLTESQTNYYMDGVLDYSRGFPYYFPNSTTNGEFHDYSIDWKPNYIAWVIDGITVRNVTKNATGPFVDDLGRFFISIWDTCGHPIDTVNWAGGASPWCSATPSAEAKSAQYKMYVDWVEIKCYGPEDDTPVDTYVPDTRKAVKSNDDPYAPGSSWGRFRSFATNFTSSLSAFTLIALFGAVAMLRRLL